MMPEYMTVSVLYRLVKEGRFMDVIEFITTRSDWSTYSEDVEDRRQHLLSAHYNFEDVIYLCKGSLVDLQK